MSDPAKEQALSDLAAVVYTQADPTTDETLFDELVRETAALYPKRPEADAGKKETDKREQAASPSKKPGGKYMLGPTTTGLDVTVTIKRSEIPTGIYHLLHPEKDPLVEVTVKNKDQDDNTRRVRVTSYLEGLSARSVRTAEIEKNRSETFKMLPVLPADRARRLTEVQWSALHVLVEDLDGKIERHDSYPILCLARTSGFPCSLFEEEDLSRYYGAWVTPNADAVQALLRRAAKRMLGERVLGYARPPAARPPAPANTPAPIHQPAPTDPQAPADPPTAPPDSPVRAQVRAIYDTLKEEHITYVPTSIAFGAPPGTLLQRARLPRETLRRKVANCLDGTLLFASLLEAASLNAAIVLVPRHAFVGWQETPGKGEWAYLETTMIQEADFDAACRSAQTQHERWSAQRVARRHALPLLRQERIWPME